MSWDEAHGAAAGAAAAGGATGDAAVRLDQGTYSDQVEGRGSRRAPRAYRGFRAKLIDYGEGLAEAAFAFIGECPPTRGVRGASPDREENEERAVRRAKAKVRQLCLSGRLDHLLTLTYRDNVTDYAQASKDLARFERKVKRKYPSFKFVAISERQRRGAWHWHLAVRGWQDVGFLRATWRSIVGEGNVDIQPPRRSCNNPRLALVHYLVKYLAKGFGEAEALNRHRFRASRGLEVPVRFVRLGVRSASRALEAVRGLVREVAGSVGFEYVKDEYASGIVFSWP